MCIITFSNRCFAHILITKFNTRRQIIKRQTWKTGIEYPYEFVLKLIKSHVYIPFMNIYDFLTKDLFLYAYISLQFIQ